MTYHVIQTARNTMRILEINSPSYALNLQSLTILKEAKVTTLPDVDSIDYWVINDDNTISISNEMQHQHILMNQLAELKHATDAAFSPIWSTYSQAEIQSWVSQEAEAIAWIADNSTPTPTIDALNPAEAKEEYCRIILNKAQMFKSGMAIVGCSIRVRDAIKAMSTAELEAVDPAALLQNAIKAVAT